METPVVFRDPLEAISKALDRIAGKADVDDLRKDVRALRARLETLEKRGVQLKIKVQHAD